MSNPPSVLPPNPNFTGLIYNPTDFSSISGDTVLTYAQASSLFILKTIADTVSGITNFINGITTSSILAKTISATCNLWTNATGEINIGTLGGRSALIHIGDGNSNLAGSGVHINNGLNTASNVQILNGTGSTGTINLGSSTSTTNAVGTLNLGSATKALTVNSPITIGYTGTPSSQTQIGWANTRVNTGQPLNLGGVIVVEPQLITTAGLYLFSWCVQYLNTTPVTYLYSNIVNGGASATATSPPINTVGNWGNSSLGTVGGNLYQSTHGTMIIGCSANTYYNLIVTTAGGSSTSCATWYQVVRIG
jgi:hypothetical protein